MSVLRQFLGYAGLVGFLVSALAVLWHAWRIARLGHVGLLVNSLRFLDRAHHAPEVRPHVRATWRWFGIAAICMVLFAIGATAM